MQQTHKPSYRAVRRAIFAIIAATLLTITAAGASSARFPFLDSLKELFGGEPTSVTMLTGQMNEDGPNGPLVDTVGDYRSAATGNWNAIATWQPIPTLPADGAPAEPCFHRTNLEQICA